MTMLVSHQAVPPHLQQNCAHVFNVEQNQSRFEISAIVYFQLRHFGVTIYV